jgi:hypothetical protein
MHITRDRKSQHSETNKTSKNPSLKLSLVILFRTNFDPLAHNIFIQTEIKFLLHHKNILNSSLKRQN